MPIPTRKPSTANAQIADIFELDEALDCLIWFDETLQQTLIQLPGCFVFYLEAKDNGAMLVSVGNDTPFRARIFT